MNEEKGPSINLKNINFINRVEEYCCCKRAFSPQVMRMSNRLEKDNIENMKVNKLGKEISDSLNFHRL